MEVYPANLYVMLNYFSIHYYPFLLTGILLGLFSCANRGGGPQGGPQDITPPKFIKSRPVNGELNVKKNELEIEFDEYIQLDKPGEKIIVSPPQMEPATIRASNKKVLVTFNDTLKPNTTYSIDFTGSIMDLNENNHLEGYTYSFSTGSELDSLQISGTVLDAENLNPLANLLIGIYDNLHDTAFTSTPPLRIARTNELGYFSIKSVKEGKYRIFALNDLNRDFYFNDPNEQLAFLDSIISPSITSEELADTAKIVSDSTANDSIVRKIKKTIFLPDSLLLFAFKETVFTQKFIKAERKEPYKISFYFNAPNTKTPIIKPLNIEPNRTDFIQSNLLADTLCYWLSDSLNWQKDSLTFSIAYEMKDSSNTSFIQTDTIIATIKAPSKKAKNQKKQTLDNVQFKTNIKGKLDIYKPLLFDFIVPVINADSQKIHLQHQKDSIWEELSVKTEKLDSFGFCYGIHYKWNPELNYKITIDSAAFKSQYGISATKTTTTFNVKADDEYARLIVRLLNYDSLAVIQLLDNKDAVIKQQKALQEGTEFDYLNPGDYYLRLFIDGNNNGIWDVGKYAKKEQAEQVYYFNTKLNLRANWDVEQEWNFKSIPWTQQKPKSLIKKRK